MPRESVFDGPDKSLPIANLQAEPKVSSDFACLVTALNFINERILVRWSLRRADIAIILFVARGRRQLSPEEREEARNYARLFLIQILASFTEVDPHRVFSAVKRVPPLRLIPGRHAYAMVPALDRARNWSEPEFVEFRTEVESFISSLCPYVRDGDVKLIRDFVY